MEQQPSDRLISIIYVSSFIFIEKVSKSPFWLLLMPQVRVHLCHKEEAPAPAHRSTASTALMQNNSPELPKYHQIFVNPLCFLHAELQNTSIIACTIQSLPSRLASVSTELFNT